MDDVGCKMDDVGCKMDDVRWTMWDGRCTMWDGKKKGGLTMVKSPLCYVEVSFTSSS